MPDFNINDAQKYQDELVREAKIIRDILQREVIDYYTQDRVDNEVDARENLRGTHRYLKDIYRKIDRILTDIERKTDVSSY